MALLAALASTDLVTCFAEPTARFGQPEIRLRLLPGHLRNQNRTANIARRYVPHDHFKQCHERKLGVIIGLINCAHDCQTGIAFLD